MAVQNDSPAVTPPSLKRKLMAVIHFGGSCFLDGGGTVQFTDPPYIELVAVGTELLKDAQGNPLSNAYGMPAYVDAPGWVGSKKIVDPAQLLALMNQFWATIDQPLDDAIVDIDITPRT